MPAAAKRPCLRPGCPELTDKGYCSTHAPEAKRARERWRGSAHSRGYGRAHRKVRAETMKRDNYLCQRCLEEGRVTPATDSHHIKKLSTNPELHLDPDNRLSVCRGCHRDLDKRTS